MRVLKGRQATIEIRDQTPAYYEFGRFLPGRILESKFKDVSPEAEEFYGARAIRVVEIEDSYESVFDIPEDQIEGIRY